MSISIWYRYNGEPPEKIDEASTQKEATLLAHEYAVAFGTLRGQHRYGKDKVWHGRKDSEPPSDPDV